MPPNIVRVSLDILPFEGLACREAGPRNRRRRKPCSNLLPRLSFLQAHGADDVLGQQRDRDPVCGHGRGWRSLGGSNAQLHGQRGRHDHRQQHRARAGEAELGRQHPRRRQQSSRRPESVRPCRRRIGALGRLGRTAVRERCSYRLAERGRPFEWLAGTAPRYQLTLGQEGCEKS